MRDNHKHYPTTKTNTISTTDKLIRESLKTWLQSQHSNDHVVRVIEELGVNHGSARVDIAVVNGILQGYEIKSDLDTLDRLMPQINAYNNVFDKMTLVVGHNHILEALDMIPDWWGVMYAKVTTDGSVRLTTLRKAEENPSPDSVSIARLLWRDEALKMLESIDRAKGFKTKTSSIIYKELALNMDSCNLKERVRETLFFRPNWRVDQELQINGG